jgi:hypothetical protein
MRLNVPPPPAFMRSRRSAAAAIRDRMAPEPPRFRWPVPVDRFACPSSYDMIAGQVVGEPYG